jgi:hypothetical protein
MWPHEFEATANELRSPRRIIVHEENRTVLFKLRSANQITMHFILNQLFLLIKPYFKCWVVLSFNMNVFNVILMFNRVNMLYVDRGIDLVSLQYQNGSREGRSF